MFLLTDGAPTDVVCPDMNERANTTTVDIVIIGIGTNAESATNWVDQIDCLDIADGKKDIYYVEEFDADNFNEIEGIVRNYTCNGLNPASPGDRGGAPWVYDDGSTGLGPVPTTDGSGNAPIDNTPSPVSSNVIAAAAMSDGGDIGTDSNGNIASEWYWYFGGAVVAVIVIGAVIGGLMYIQKTSAVAINSGVGNGSNDKPKVTAMDSYEMELPHSVTPSAVLSIEEVGVDFAGGTGGGELYCE